MVLQRHKTGYIKLNRAALNPQDQTVLLAETGKVRDTRAQACRLSTFAFNPSGSAKTARIAHVFACLHVNIRLREPALGRWPLPFRRANHRMPSKEIS